MPTTKYKDPRANQCADFFFPDGKIPQWFDDQVAQRERVAAEVYRPGLPPEALRRVHTPWEMRTSRRGLPWRADFWFDEATGAAFVKWHHEPVNLGRLVGQDAKWAEFEFRPFCWTWEEAERAAAAKTTEP